MPSAQETAQRIEARLKNNLAQMPKDENEKILDHLWIFVGNAIINNWSQKQICTEATKLICRALPFTEVSLAIRIPKTDTFRYVAMMGFKPEVEKVMFDKIYSEKEAIGHDREPSINIDGFLDFELAEGTSLIDDEYERQQYNRPKMLQEERKAFDQMKDGDYLVLYFRGVRGELLGYVELEAPRNRKLPQGNVLKWLEIFGMTFGMLLQSSKRYE
jgi:hypothetical protein